VLLTYCSFLLPVPMVLPINYSGCNWRYCLTAWFSQASSHVVSVTSAYRTHLCPLLLQTSNQLLWMLPAADHKQCRPSHTFPLTKSFHVVEAVLAMVITAFWNEKKLHLLIKRRHPHEKHNCAHSLLVHSCFVIQGSTDPQVFSFSKPGKFVKRKQGPWETWIGYWSP